MTLTLPLALHESAIDRLRIRDGDGKIVADPELEAIHAAMTAARAEADRIGALHEAVSNDPTISAASAALKVRETALRLGERASEKLDQARARVAKEIEKLKRSTAAPIVTKDTAPLQAEVRQRLAAMNAKDRAKAISDAMTGGDDLIIAAVLTAPALLSGFTAAEHNMHLEQYRRARHPADADRMSRLAKAIGAIDRAGQSLIAFVEAAASSPAALNAETGTKRVREAVASAAAE